MRRRRGTAWAAAATAAVLVSGCTGGGRPHSAMSSESFSTVNGASGSPQAALPASVQLVPLLAPAPPGAKPVDRPQELSLDQYVADIYNSAYATSEVASLQQDSVDGIAHLAWVTSEGTTIDEYLIRCATALDATTRYGVLFALWSERPTLPAPTAPSDGQVSAFARPGPDSNGDDTAVVFAVRSKIVMSVYANDLVPIDPTKLDAWAATQIARLPV